MPPLFFRASPTLSVLALVSFVFFLFTAPATTAIYTLSLHDALPIFPAVPAASIRAALVPALTGALRGAATATALRRSEEHTSELQSRGHLVCRLLLEKKKTTHNASNTRTRRLNDRNT